MKLSIAHNPLERPTVEQVRQGMAEIRRFFGLARPAGGPTGAGAESEAMRVGRQGPPNDESQRSTGVADAWGLSRHSWAAPGTTILMFNCHSCAFEVAEGDASQLPADTELELVAQVASATLWLYYVIAATRMHTAIDGHWQVRAASTCPHSH